MFTLTKLLEMESRTNMMVSECMKIYRNADALFLVMQKEAIIYRWKENMIYEFEKYLHLSPSLGCVTHSVLKQIFCGFKCVLFTPGVS
jgi:hypothetical protein